jgi:SAM-dependent methyltransferase
VIKNKTFYAKTFKKYGRTPQGLSWSSPKTQEIRFLVITELLADEIKKSSIVDAGCGFGDLYGFWLERDLIPKSYIGIDSFEEFIKIAQKSFSKTAFLQRDILKDELPLAHWYVASGSLNILSSFETWLFLEKMLVHATKGIVFNFLCGEKQSETFNYNTKQEMESFFVEKGFTCKMIDGYLENDMSVMIKKDIT